MCLYQTDYDLSSMDPTEVYSENSIGLCPLEGILVGRREVGSKTGDKNLFRPIALQGLYITLGKGSGTTLIFCSSSVITMFILLCYSLFWITLRTVCV